MGREGYRIVRGVMGAQRRSQGAPSLEYLSRGAPEVSRVPVEYLTGSHHPLLLLHCHFLGAETGGRQREGSLDVGGRVDLDSWARLHGGGGGGRCALRRQQGMEGESGSLLRGFPTFAPHTRAK